MHRRWHSIPSRDKTRSTFTRTNVYEFVVQCAARMKGAAIHQWTRNHTFQTFIINEILIEGAALGFALVTLVPLTKWVEVNYLPLDNKPTSKDQKANSR